MLNSNMLKLGSVVDEMSSGNLFYIKKGIETIFGKLNFIKIRKFDENYLEYRISVDFTVRDYSTFKVSLSDAIIKKYDTFELIQFKNEKSIINIVSLSAKDDYYIAE